VPTTKENVILKELADEYKIDFSRGSVNNVLDRYYKAAINYDCDYVIRVTGDNPFIDVQFASDTVKRTIEENADICAPKNLPLGIAVEIISMSSLDATYKEAKLPHQLEHVSPFIKENTERFKVIKFMTDFKCEFENLRLTIDAPEDLEFAQIISQNLYKGVPYPLGDIVNFLQLNPQLLLINSQIKQRPMTYFTEANVK
jgi:spore coat polysaccharide biosynthesis protein SpsF